MDGLVERWAAPTPPGASSRKSAETPAATAPLSMRRSLSSTPTQGKPASPNPVRHRFVLPAGHHSGSWVREGFGEPIPLRVIGPDAHEVFAPQKLFGQVVRERAQHVTWSDLAGVGAERRQLRGKERAHVERGRDG